MGRGRTLECMFILILLHLFRELCPTMPDGVCFNSVPFARVGKILSSPLFLEYCSKAYNNVVFFIYGILNAVTIVYRVVVNRSWHYVLRAFFASISLSTIFTSTTLSIINVPIEHEVLLKNSCGDRCLLLYCSSSLDV